MPVVTEVVFEGGEELRQEEQLFPGLKVAQKVSVVGKDLVGGQLALAEAGVFTQPSPDWITNFSTAGKNKFVQNLEEGRALVARRAEREAVDWDRFSDVSTKSRATADQMDV